MEIEQRNKDTWRINGIEVKAKSWQGAMKKYLARLEDDVKSLRVERNHLRKDNERLKAAIKKALAPDEAHEKMKALVKWHGDDPEAFHGEADDLLCEILKGLGYDLTVKVFQSQKRW